MQNKGHKKLQQVMIESQRIHPSVDMEAAPPPTSPLVPQGSSVSEKGSPLHHQHQPPVTSTVSRATVTEPATNTATTRKTARSCLCKCLCWTISLILLILVIIAAIAGILYLVFQPKIPKYSVDSLRISDLRLNYDMTLYAKFDVKITANNPNKKIGIYYEKGGKLSVWYTDTLLCAGTIPKFYQGHRNITKLDVSLSGQRQYGSTLMSALQEQQQTGRIPLDLKVSAPIAVKLGRLKLKKVKILGDCLLVVDSLTTNSLISIKASNCKFRLKL
ncbi:NDR1/HIN1-like protein 6 [Mercurialis annua]|uniref:NDR1/HIN1-like protein 6 n=1 Tax=Mercurialis annua TaxID=3986 RepID=UPI00215F6372|nr:NDR1/HIN1-like protein 6 [Mercurialis annua]